MSDSTYTPLYQRGKRDPKRRYVDTATGHVISRRQYDQRYGRIAESRKAITDLASHVLYTPNEIAAFIARKGEVVGDAQSTNSNPR